MQNNRAATQRSKSPQGSLQDVEHKSCLAHSSEKGASHGLWLPLRTSAEQKGTVRCPHSLQGLWLVNIDRSVRARGRYVAGTALKPKSNSSGKDKYVHHCAEIRKAFQWRWALQQIPHRCGKGEDAWRSHVLRCLAVASSTYWALGVSVFHDNVPSTRHMDPACYICGLFLGGVNDRDLDSKRGK